MSAERDESRRLIEELSDDRVPVVLAQARRQSSQVAAGEWSPPLAEGFGRS